jgi:hypothetical protein
MTSMTMAKLINKQLLLLLHMGIEFLQDKIQLEVAEEVRGIVFNSPSFTRTWFKGMNSLKD